MTRRLLCALTLLLLTTTAFADANTNYSGKWILDRAQSANLPPFYEHVKSHALEIEQKADALDVHVTITSERPDPEHFDFHYALDGTTSQTKTSIRTPDGMIDVPTALTATRLDGGRLQITIARELPFAPGAKGVTVETWELRPDGKSLAIHRADDTPRGKMESDLLFVRQ